MQPSPSHSHGPAESSELIEDEHRATTVPLSEATKRVGVVAESRLAQRILLHPELYKATAVQDNFKKKGKGTSIFFWHDRWLFECSLKTQYPILFDLILDPNITVDRVLQYNKFYLFFRRPINGPLRNQLNELYSRLSQVSLNIQEDEIIWR
jgi:hypothetical protein